MGGWSTGLIIAPPRLHSSWSSSLPPCCALGQECGTRAKTASREGGRDKAATTVRALVTLKASQKGPGKWKAGRNRARKRKEQKSQGLQRQACGGVKNERRSLEAQSPQVLEGSVVSDLPNGQGRVGEDGEREKPKPRGGVEADRAEGWGGWGTCRQSCMLPVVFLIALLRYNSQTTQFTILKCTIQWLLVESHSCATITKVKFRTFPSPVKKKPCTGNKRKTKKDKLDFTVENHLCIQG